MTSNPVSGVALRRDPASVTSLSDCNICLQRGASSVFMTRSTNTNEWEAPDSVQQVKHGRNRIHLSLTRYSSASEFEKRRLSGCLGGKWDFKLSQVLRLHSLALSLSLSLCLSLALEPILKRPLSHEWSPRRFLPERCSMNLRFHDLHLYCFFFLDFLLH